MKTLLTVILSIFLFSNYSISQDLLVEKSYSYGKKDKFNDMILTTDNNLLLVGESFDNKALIVKTNLYGDTIWTATYDGKANSVVELLDGNFLISGKTNNEGMLLKISNTGDSLWVVENSTNDGSHYNSLIELNDSSIVAVGYTEPPNSGPGGGLIRKYDQFGNVLWSKTIGQAGINKIKIVDSGHFIVTGWKGWDYIDFFLSMFDTSGNQLFFKKYHETDDAGANDVILLNNNEYILTGIKDNSTHEASLMRVDSTEIIWSKDYFNSISNSSSEANSSTICNDVLISTGRLGNDLFIFINNLSGDSINSVVLSNYSKQVGNKVINVGDSLILVAGYLQRNGNDTIDAYLVGWNKNQIINSIKPVGEDIDLRVYPNPVKNYLNVELPLFGDLEISSLRIIDCLGKVKYERAKIYESRFQIDVGFLDSGLFVLQINFENKTSYRKVLIVK